MIIIMITMITMKTASSNQHKFETPKNVAIDIKKGHKPFSYWLNTANTFYVVHYNPHPLPLLSRAPQPYQFQAARIRFINPGTLQVNTRV